MKVFWALFLVLAAAAGGMLLVRARAGAPAGAAAEVRVSTPPASEQRDADEPRQAATEAPAVQGGRPSVDEAEARAVPVAGASADAHVARPEGQRIEATEVNGSEADVQPEATDANTETSDAGSTVETDAATAAEDEPVAPVTSDEEHAATEEATDADVAEEQLSAPLDTEAEELVPDAPPSPELAAGSDDGAAEPDVAGNVPSEPAPSEVAAPVAAEPVVVEPGAIVLNGQHRIPGEGTAEKPFVVTWDTLVALEQDYQPKKGKPDLPAWVAALDGKHVAITGFIAFPFIAPTADECMVMLNQWDGCCIGVPPTPYDAVEVKLADTLDLQQGIVNYGTITGIFRTDPYLVNGWLIGLYVMDDAALTNAGGKNAPGF